MIAKKKTKREIVQEMLDVGVPWSEIERRAGVSRSTIRTAALMKRTGLPVVDKSRAPKTYGVAIDLRGIPQVTLAQSLVFKSEDEEMFADDDYRDMSATIKAATLAIRQRKGHVPLALDV